MVGYSPAYKIPVFVTLSKSNGLRVWYMHEGNCRECIHEKNCREYLLNEAAERGLELSENDKTLPSTLLALKVFEKNLGGEMFG
ncbi:hypothetical protein JW865_00625 [Candidatus Bathyarchaeota archaeon]|nr:hypothetical protein [Candidatus Bathyarchaeota archaeon]